ncbi:transposase family protein [Streptomyces antimycoticus]|uniref:transposase family protein n=1 Tax=Streptomyces antimycoticus TaxID=68175 RepID=UPI001D153DF5|nr:transposase family protein [Streptomyces antimycoticus]
MPDFLTDRIPGASLTEAAHLVTVEHPAPVLAALCSHLDSGTAARDAAPGPAGRLAEVPDPRDPRGARHALAAIPVRRTGPSDPAAGSW